MSDEIETPEPPATPPTPPGPRLVIPLIPKQRRLSDEHLANLRASGLTDDTISLAQLYTEDRPKVLAEIVQRRTWNRAQGAACVFPFYVPDKLDVIACRVRPTTPIVEISKSGKERPRKYDQASSHGSLTYYTPRGRIARWYADATRPLYWTEGEKKALVLDQLELTCVGLTGVWNWVDSAHKKAGGGERLHPMISDHAVVSGRAHVIVYDGDCRKNDKVMQAAQRLAGVLIAAGAVSVRFVAPPEGAEKGIDDFYAARGEAATRALLDSATDIEPIDPAQPLIPVRKCAAYRDAEAIPGTLRVPDGYELQRDGSLWRTAADEKHSDARVTHAPMFVVRVLVDHHGGDERVDLAWLRAGELQTICASRRAISDARQLVAELSPYGAPVNSGNAAKLVEWIEAFETCNTAAIARVASVSATGWHVADGARVFVADAPIAADGAPATIALDTRGDRRRMFAALTPRGELAGHVAALRRAWDASPVCAAVIAGALAVPLLEPLRAPNFAVHLVGESSRGKTSQLKIAASVFGDPGSASWVASWNATLAGAEARAATLNDLPQCYDEIGGGDAQAAERMLYALINGGGRTRATRELAARESVSWRTIVLSTGERELADESTATGAQVRVLQLPVDGFGTLTAAEVDALRAECAAHAGALGRAWLAELVSVDDWAPYRAALAQCIASLRGVATDPLQGRMAAYFGLLSLTEAMVAESFGLGRTDGGTLRAFFAAIGQRETVDGIAERARDAVEAWITTEADAFPELQYGPHGGLDEPKSNGVRVRHGFRRPDGAVLVVASEFRALCKKSRLSSRAVVREWLRLGWTEVDSGRLDKQIRIGTARGRYVVLTPGIADLPTRKVGE